MATIPPNQSLLGMFLHVMSRNFAEMQAHHERRALCEQVWRRRTYQTPEDQLIIWAGVTPPPEDWVKVPYAEA